MILIGLTGKARSGKDTAALLIEETLQPRPVIKMAFAYPLKLAVQEMFGLLKTVRWDERFKETPDDYWKISPRQMDQAVGTAMRTQFGPDFWVRRWKLDLRTFREINPNYVIIVTDVRFDNEAHAIRSEGGIIIKLEREEVLKGDTAKHVSEQGLSKEPDFTIENKGSLEALEDSVKKLIGSLYGRV